MLFVLWMRQSNEECTRLRDSFPRQLSTLLFSPAFRNLKQHDTLMAVVETCSSSKHPMTDRRLFRSLPRTLLREATASSTNTTPLKMAANIAFAGLTLSALEPMMFVIWARQSNEDSTRC